MRWGRSSRRRNVRRRCGRRRWRGSRRCGGRRRRTRRWRPLRRLLGLSVGTKLLPGLRHDQRRGLRVRWSRGQLQRRESRRGKQQESKFCHDGLGPRKILGNKACQQTLAINKQALGRIVASIKRELVFISDSAKSGFALVHCAFRRSFQIAVLHFSPCGYSRHPGAESAPKPIFPVPVAGEGVLGPCGPRTGNSSGLRPGNSSGHGGSPGSRMGGGTSGRGLPGGLSCGGSDGRPGLIGGFSGGSIGISRFPEFRFW